jgi:hypothetical protein
MSIFQLQWHDLQLSETCYQALGDEDQYTLEWHSAGATLYIVGKDLPKIDLRLEREILNIMVRLMVRISRSTF